jgi:hypothetical protein
MGAYGCPFIGFQDALLTNQGTQLFSNCYIEGSVDFIWGFLKTYFHQCLIESSPLTLPVHRFLLRAVPRPPPLEVTCLMLVLLLIQVPTVPASDCRTSAAHTPIFLSRYTRILTLIRTSTPPDGQCGKHLIPRLTMSCLESKPNISCLITRAHWLLTKY